MLSRSFSAGDFGCIDDDDVPGDVVTKVGRMRRTRFGGADFGEGGIDRLAKTLDGVDAADEDDDDDDVDFRPM